MIRIITALFLLCSPAWAQPNIGPVQWLGSSGPAAYSGPGDILSGADEWYGFTAYNLAYATGSNPAAIIRNSSGSTQTINILSTGYFDVASAKTFAGTAAVCTGSASGTTTMTITSCSSGTIGLSDNVFATGIVGPSTVQAFGTGSGGAGTYTLQAAQTTSGSVTITFYGPLTIQQMFDQSGNGRNQVMSTVGNQPALYLDCGQGLSCAFFPGITQFLQWSGSLSISQPFFESAVGLQSGQFTNSGRFFAADASSGAYVGLLLANSAANTISIYAGATLGATSVANNINHAYQGLFNGASSVLNVDGNADVTGNAGSTALATATGSAIGTQGGAYWTGTIYEVGIWPSTASSGVRASLCHRQNTVYTLGISC